MAFVANTLYLLATNGGYGPIYKCLSVDGGTGDAIMVDATYAGFSLTTIPAALEAKFDVFSPDFSARPADLPAGGVNVAIGPPAFLPGGDQPFNPRYVPNTSWAYGSTYNFGGKSVLWPTAWSFIVVNVYSTRGPIGSFAVASGKAANLPKAFSLLY